MHACIEIISTKRKGWSTSGANRWSRGLQVVCLCWNAKQGVRNGCRFVTFGYELYGGFFSLWWNSGSKRKLKDLHGFIHEDYEDYEDSTQHFKSQCGQQNLEEIVARISWQKFRNEKLKNKNLVTADIYEGLKISGRSFQVSTENMQSYSSSKYEIWN